MPITPPEEYSTFKPSGTPGKPIKSLSDRKSDFYSYIIKSDPPQHCPSLGPCHIWTKSCLKSGGYGQFNINGTMWRCHVLAFLWSGGVLEEGQHVCHKCDNPKCCNPEHLFVGSSKDNMHDMISKGRDRHPKWEDAGGAQLTTEKASLVLAIWKTGKVTKAQIGRYFGVTRGHIGLIVNGLAWKGLSPSSNSELAFKIASEIAESYKRKPNASSFKPGALHPNARLTNEAIDYIKANYKHGKSVELAAIFGVTDGYIREIANGRRRKTHSGTDASNDSCQVLGPPSGALPAG